MGDGVPWGEGGIPQGTAEDGDSVSVQVHIIVEVLQAQGGVGSQMYIGLQGTEAGQADVYLLDGVMMDISPQ